MEDVLAEMVEVILAEHDPAVLRIFPHQGSSGTVGARL
jgi:hypothetical protein